MARKRTKAQCSTQRDDSEDEGQPKRSRLNENKENVTENNRMEVDEPAQSSRSKVNYRDVKSVMANNLRCGKIKKIYLQNFMCHANFEVNLNKCINIIVGLNGSGKSAVLTAIAIGLGGKAASTARSTSLKELVRRGEPSATIEITLANDGLCPYEEDVFGDEIIVVRTINANSGASTYKLKTKHGKTVSTSRQDLLKLTLCLNIQVENPVLILNQDAARSFLKDCDPRKLYQFFMKATQIEAIIDKLNSCYQTAVSSKNQLVNMERTVKRFKEEIDIIKQKLTRLQSVKSLRQVIAEYNNELQWLKVTVVERELNESNTNLNKKREEVRNITDLVNNKAKYEKDIQEQIRLLASTFQQLTTDSEANNQSYEIARRDYEGERDKLSELQNTNKTFDDRLKKKCLPNIHQLEQEISDHENNPMNVEKLRLENEAQINEVQKKIDDNRAVFDNTKRDLQMFMQNLNEETERRDEMKEHLRREQNRITTIDGQINQYKNAGKNTLSVYGASCERLLKELESLHRQKRFTQLPKAFLGRYIEVTDKKYRGAVETILRDLLTAFIVNCDKDRIILAEVLKKYTDISKPQIITTEFVQQVYDVRRGMVKLQNKSDAAVLVNVMKVNDPVVMNCLIDHKRIERIVLVENSKTAMQLTQDERSVPQNLFKVIVINPLSEYYPAPNYRTYSMRSNPPRYIQTNFTELIEEMQHERQNVEQKYNSIRNKYHDVTRKIEEFTGYVNEKKRLMEEFKRKNAVLSRQMEELKDVEFPENTDIDFLRQQLEEEKKTKAVLEKKIDESREKLNQRKQIVDRYKQAMDKELESHRQSRDKMRTVQLDMDKLQKKLSNMKSDIETKGRQIANLQQEADAIQAKVNELQRKVAEMTGKIKGNRVTSYRTEDELMRDIKIAEKRIEGIESSNESIVDVELQLNNKTIHYENANNAHKALDQVLKRLTQLRESRYVYVRRLRQHMSIRIQHKFHQLMQLRNYSAEIKIDHKEQKLHLKIIPRDGEIEGAVSNTKALSGGERSYSTVSFLLSLWSCVDHPFYFLDEYDVFSDEYNRHMMTMLLLNEAEKKKDRQFGFLTPQDFSNVHSSDTISIHKLEDPERRN